MNKKIFTLAIATLFCVTLFAQQKTENCPFGGRENCTGYCGRFVDENNDKYCDYSKLTDTTNIDKSAKQESTTKNKKGNHE